MNSSNKLTPGVELAVNAAAEAGVPVSLLTCLSVCYSLFTAQERNDTGPCAAALHLPLRAPASDAHIFRHKEWAASMAAGSQDYCSHILQPVAGQSYIYTALFCSSNVYNNMLHLDFSPNSTMHPRIPHTASQGTHNQHTHTLPS